MKARNIYLLISRDVMTDSNDNMTSILKIIDKFNLTVNRGENEKEIPGDSKITIPVTYSFATSWHFSERLKGETFVNLRIKIIDPEGKDLGGPPVQENLVPEGIEKINLNINAQGMPATVNGKYTLKAELLDKSMKVLASAEYPFEVEITWTKNRAEKAE